MTTKQYIKLGWLTALISFLLGTAILGFYYQTEYEYQTKLESVGLGFIALAGLVNLVILISIIVRSIKDSKYKKQLWAVCGLMVLNIPIMLLYCWFVSILNDAMRITFSNSTQTTLTNINIIGCGGGHIEKLDVGASKTVWVDITGDCSINIDYLSNGQQKNENVVGYATSSSGHKMKYNIGKQNEE